MNSYTDQDNVTEMLITFMEVPTMWWQLFTLTTNVLIEYWPSPIFTNTPASYDHDCVHYQCDIGSENSICWMQYRCIPLRKSTIIFNVVWLCLHKLHE